MNKINIPPSAKKPAAIIAVIALLLTIPLTLSFVSQNQDIRQRAGGPDCDTAHAGLDSEEYKMINLINRHLQIDNRGYLVFSGYLNNSASSLSEYMALTGDVSGVDSKGRDFENRLIGCGYPASFAAVQNHANEITGTNGSAQEQLDVWLASPEMRAVLEDYSWEAIGVGRAYDPAQNKWFWTADFSTKNPKGESTDDNVGFNAPTFAPQVTASVSATINPLEPTKFIATNRGFRITFTTPGIGKGEGLNNAPLGMQMIGQVELSKDGEVYNPYLFSTPIYDETVGAYIADTYVPDPGTYGVKIKTNNSLWKNVGTYTLEQDQFRILPLTKLIVGDINQDNLINLSDYSILLSCLDGQVCNSQSRSDLNKDGKVDRADLNIFYSALTSRQGD